MADRPSVSQPQGSQSVFDFPANQFPASLQDSFDSLLDEFDRLRQQGQQGSISDFLDRRLVGRISKTTLETQVYQTLVKHLIEIDLCYRFNASSQPTRSSKTSDDQPYNCFGPWAVKHAIKQRAGLLDSMHRRSCDPISDPLHLKDEFIFKPTFAGGRFAVQERLGTGGMGTVFRVIEKETLNEYALKTIKNKCPSLLYRLKQEFRSLVGLESHPNLSLIHI